MKKDIKQIIAEGESQQTEFKSSFNVEAMESITAFANTEGGCVLVGISKLATELATNLSQLVTDLSVQVKTLIINLNKQYLSFEELKHATKHATISRQYFSKAYIRPAFNIGLIAMLFPDNQRHPKQKYYLTERGKEVLQSLRISEKPKNDEENDELAPNLSQLAPNLSVQVKKLIISLKEKYLSIDELQVATKVATKVATSSRQYFRRVFLAPAFKEGFIDLLYPDKPNHPKQKYYLTEKGKEVLKALEA